MDLDWREVQLLDDVGSAVHFWYIRLILENDPTHLPELAAPLSSP